MSFRRFLGLDRPGVREADGTAQPPPPGTPGETLTVRRIVARLEALPPEQARYLAGFAYVLSRAAHADLDISDAESELMEQYIVEFGGLDRSQAVLVVEIAKFQSRLHGGTEDFVVTREFSQMATDEQKIALVRCCFAIGAVDDTITAEEASVVNQIARELGLDRETLNELRAEYHDKLSVIKAMRRALGT